MGIDTILNNDEIAEILGINESSNNESLNKNSNIELNKLNPKENDKLNNIV